MIIAYHILTIAFVCHSAAFIRQKSIVSYRALEVSLRFIKQGSGNGNVDDQGFGRLDYQPLCSGH